MRDIPNRWLILFVLFFARLSMAFQFQAVASLSPFILESYTLNLADIGLLIGLYLAPGVVVATSLAGTVADWSGNINSIFIFGVGLSVCAMLALVGFRLMAPRHVSPQ